MSYALYAPSHVRRSKARLAEFVATRDATTLRLKMEVAQNECAIEAMIPELCAIVERAVKRSRRAT
ncbi:hypothetical protein [Phyllobacterium sp. YR531]|uniref:hypothetical protein n=1 Tax=Phyllobacterium sp. YR531 TaxID=1144343 RepID=UPI00026FBAF7|nr:hypothetical protein [Phyllobacterium sp. YR531]EJN04283.1 hypothetical protein PMI41_01922 [Phyllobacterium sp. YR531]